MRSPSLRLAQVPRSSLACCAAAAIALGLAAPAAAQTGPFVPSQPYWIGPFGSPGVIIQPTEIWVDVNGNGLESPGVDTYHLIPSGLATGWAVRLTPSRRGPA